MRPPGVSTRNISASTAGLSVDRLMTQLEMTTSTEPSGSGTSSIVPLRNSTLVGAGLGGVGPGQVEHLVGHVDAVGEAGGADPPGGQQDVDAAAGTEVEHRLAGLQLGDHHRVAAAEARGHRLGRQLALLVRAVETGSERVVDLGAAAATGRGRRLLSRCSAVRRAARTPVEDGERRLSLTRHRHRGGGVPCPDLLAYCVLLLHAGPPPIDGLRCIRASDTHRHLSMGMAESSLWPPR